MAASVLSCTKVFQRVMQEIPCRDQSNQNLIVANYKRSLAFPCCISFISYLVYFEIQMAGFYMKSNTGLKMY